MKKIYSLSFIILLLLLPFLLHPTYGQESNLHPNEYLLHLSLKEGGVGYMRKVGNFGLGVKAGYQYPLRKEMYSDSGNPLRDLPNNLVRFLIYKGYTTELLFNFATSSHGNRHILSAGYGHINTGTLIFDPAASAGCNSCEYAESIEEFHSYFLKYNYLIHTSDHLFCNLQFGIDRRNITKRYAIEGLYNDQQPSDRIEKFSKTPLVIDVGLVYIFND